MGVKGTAAYDGDLQYIFQQFIIDFYAFFLGFVAEIDAKDDRKIFIFNGLQREKVF